MIIDEVRHVPSLLPAIKKVVDKDNRLGQYLLTGSANIQSLPSVRESLAGRVRKIRLRPLAQGELLGKEPKFLEHAFSQSFDQQSEQMFDRDDIIKMAFRGGFPEAVRLKGRDRKNWHKDYFDALLERDLKDIINIKRQDAMKELFHVLAAWSSKFMDVSAIGSGLSIKRSTIESYINALEALYLIEKVNPWLKTDYDRVGKQSKIFMTDCGLMTSILGWRIDDVQFDNDKIGKLIETFIFNELSAQIDASDGEYSLYHYRDREKREIDFIIEREDGAILGVEVKSGSAVDKSSFKHHKWFKNNLIKGKKPYTGIVLYTGEFTASFGDEMWAVPISNLWA